MPDPTPQPLRPTPLRERFWCLLVSPPRAPSPRRAFLAMVAITLAAVVLRASGLNYPPALTDEAFTFWRVSGTLGQLLDNLRDDAFVPLHYQIVWLLTKLLGTGVWVLRLPSAAAGAAMPYAVYRLGRLAGGRRAGVIAAAVAAASAFLAFFERNAKMYAPAWTLMTLAIGSLLMFSRARAGTRSRRQAWLSFVLFGVGATAEHAVVCIPLALLPLVIIAWARRRKMVTFLWALLATAIVMAAPMTYYTFVNTWFDRAGGLSGRSQSGPTASDNGLMWIEEWQGDRTPQNLLAQCGSAYLGGAEWPVAGEAFGDPLAEAVRQRIRDVAVALGAATVAAVVAHALSHRRRTRRGIAVGTAGVLLVGVPLYGFYLRSFRAFASPWSLGAWAIAGAALGVAAVFFATRRPAVRRTAGWAVLMAAALTLAWATACYAYSHAPTDRGGLPRWNPLWMPRYSGFVAPLLCVGVGLIVATTPTRPLRWLVGLAVIGLNLWVTGLAWLHETEMPWPQITRDVVAAAHRSDTTVAMNWVYFPGQPFLPPMPSPHYALVRAAGVEVDPPGFRAGRTWPYRPGPEVRRLLATLHYEPVATLRFSARRPSLRTVVLWRTTGGRPADEMKLPGWRTVEHQVFAVRSIWTWQPYQTYDRVVLLRD